MYLVTYSPSVSLLSYAFWTCQYPILLEYFRCLNVTQADVTVVVERTQLHSHLPDVLRYTSLNRIMLAGLVYGKISNVQESIMTIKYLTNNTLVYVGHSLLDMGLKQ